MGCIYTLVTFYSYVTVIIDKKYKRELDVEKEVLERVEKCYKYGTYRWNYIFDKDYIYINLTFKKEMGIGNIDKFHLL